jgi:4,5-DOPA dioxygenase extradiol
MTKPMPTLFISHGSPTTILETNSKALKFWKTIPKFLPETPKAIVCVSAHWMTYGGVKITSSENPETIYDFGGFQDELYEMTYKSPGNPSLAKQIQSLIEKQGIKCQLDSKRGYDHGCWTILKSIFPDATIPVIQVSLIGEDSLNIKIGEALSSLKKEGVLIICSGGIVHNIGMTMKYFSNIHSKPQVWAEEFQQHVQSVVSKPLKEMKEEIQDFKKLKDSKLAIPTSEHFLVNSICVKSVAFGCCGWDCR